MWGKKTVTAEEMAQGLLKLCGMFAEDLYTGLTPILQAQGLLRESAEKDAFALEAMQLYIWLISYVLADERAVLRALHRMFAAWDADNFQARASQTMEQRFEFYTKATHRDRELRAEGHPPMCLAYAALQCLLNKPGETTFGLSVSVAVSRTLLSAFPAVDKFRAQFKIRGA